MTGYQLFSSLSGQRDSTLRVVFHFIIRTSSAGLKPGACSASPFNCLIPPQQTPADFAAAPEGGRGRGFSCHTKKSTGFCMLVLSFVFVGIAGFEPTTPCSQSRCANRTALHPECA